MSGTQFAWMKQQLEEVEGRESYLNLKLAVAEETLQKKERIIEGLKKHSEQVAECWKTANEDLNQSLSQVSREKQELAKENEELRGILLDPHQTPASDLQDKQKEIEACQRYIFQATLKKAKLESMNEGLKKELKHTQQVAEYWKTAAEDWKSHANVLLEGNKRLKKKVLEHEESQRYLDIKIGDEQRRVYSGDTLTVTLWGEPLQIPLSMDFA